MEQISERILGKNLKAAMEFAKEGGWELRIMREDNHLCIGSCEIKSNRINVATEDGVVTEVMWVG